uniref:Col_cuticle_N domain-containing protein n=1 Tax=Globodera pallida TaxID=36090 RepID=A0A183CEB3_GLOPA
MVTFDQIRHQTSKQIKLWGWGRCSPEATFHRDTSGRMSVHFATIGAVALSGTTVLLCLASLVMVQHNLQQIWLELDSEMDQFKLDADDLWKDLLAMGAGTPSNRARRQQPSPAVVAGPVHVASGPLTVGSVCNCNPTNNCPAGTQGQPGRAGPPGLPGVPGKEGVPGFSAEDSHSSPFKGCTNCPQGPQGTPGESGKPGIRGMRGPSGQPGVPGRDGVPGFPGETGGEGALGLSGAAGTPGEKGEDQKKENGLKGPRGMPGNMGVEGPIGEAGNLAPPGRQGASGMPGAPGPAGTPGAEGENGGAGSNGQPGRDAEYCKCPGRDGAAAHRGGATAGSSLRTRRI